MSAEQNTQVTRWDAFQIAHGIAVSRFLDLHNSVGDKTATYPSLQDIFESADQIWEYVNRK